MAQVSMAANSPNGGMCLATGQYTFMIQGPPRPAPALRPVLPPTLVPRMVNSSFPKTIMPTRRPRSPPSTNSHLAPATTALPVSLAPLTNGSTTSCALSADIVCHAIRAGQFVSLCTDIPNPTNVKCSNGSIPTAIAFLLRPTGVAENITVTVRAKTTQTNFSVSSGQIFTAMGDFTDGATISIDGIGSKTIDTSCTGRPDLTLGNQYGPIDLVGFQNREGNFTSVYALMFFTELQISVQSMLK